MRRWLRRGDDEAQRAIRDAQDQRDRAHNQTPRVNQVTRWGQEQARRTDELLIRIRMGMMRRSV